MKDEPHNKDFIVFGHIVTELCEIKYYMKKTADSIAEIAHAQKQMLRYKEREDNIIR